MANAVDILEERVCAAANLIASLRVKVKSLERELLTDHAAVPSSPTPAPDSSLIEELERLRAERVTMRESIRGLLREIDRVSW